MRNVNVYGFSIHRKSQLQAGYHSGDSLAVVAGNPSEAKAAAVAFLGNDLARITGPTVIVERALYDDGSGGASPAPVRPPVCKTTPYVSGTGAVGQILNCTMGNWTGEPTSYAYAWQRDGMTVNTSGPNYTILSPDLGRTLTCVVTATNALGSTAAPPSNPIMVTG